MASVYSFDERMDKGTFGGAMLIIACVLKSGGDYDAEYVLKLYRGCKRNIRKCFRFVCLSDCFEVPFEYNSEIHVIPLRHNWPGWWSKIELFDQEEFRDHRIFYLDLDTVITGDITDIVSHDSPFAGIEDFNKPRRLQSSIMSFAGGDLWRNYYLRFMEDPLGAIQKYRSDQDFLDDFDTDFEFLQDTFPGNIISFKAGNGSASRLISGPRTLPERVKIVCFHGKPRPREVKGRFQWMLDCWK